MLVRHSLIYLLSRAVSAGVLLFTLWWFSHVLPPAEYGFYVSAMALATLTGAAVFQWLRLTVLRYLAHHADPAALIGNALRLFALLMGLVALPLPLMGLLPVGPWTLLIPAVVCLSLTLALAEFARELLRARLRAAEHAIFSISNDVLMLGFSWLVLQQGWGGLGLVVAMSGACLLTALIALLRSSQGVWSSRYDPAVMRDLLQYGLPLAGGYTLGAILSNLDRLLLPWLAGPAATGLYGIASGLARQSLFMLMQSVNLSAYPLVLQAYRQGDVAAARHQLRENAVLLLAIALPATTGLMTLAPLIAHTLLGPAYQVDAARLLPWLALGTLLLGLRSFYADQAFHLAQDTRTPLICLGGALLIALPLSVALIMMYRLEGAVYGTVTGFALALVLSGWQGRRVFALPVPWRELCWISAGSAFMSALLWPWREGESWLQLSLAVSAGVLVIAVALLAGNILSLRKLLRVRRA
jgi:O-antigen/teichoic acid export membrane protein